MCIRDRVNAPLIPDLERLADEIDGPIAKRQIIAKRSDILHKFFVLSISYDPLQPFHYYEVRLA
jgi:hypothetical protein